MGRDGADKFGGMLPTYAVDGIHRPTWFGFRFSRNAALPSWWSAMWFSCGCTMFSTSR